MSVSLDFLSTPVSYHQFESYSAQRGKVKESFQEEHYRKHVIVFGLTWVMEDFNYLVGCTSHGEIVIWKLPKQSDGNEGSSDGVMDTTKAILRKKISNGKLYSIRTETINSKLMLIASGDDGVFLLDWEKDIQIQNPPETITPTTKYHTHPSPLESRSIEVNDVQVLDGRYLFGAAGDSFGVYKWDLETEKLVCNYTSPSSGYLQSIQLVPDNTRPNTLLAGGEGGRVEFWNVNDDSSMGQIDLTTVTAADTASSNTSTTATIARKRSKSSASRWISSICAFDANWFTVAGGNSGVSSSGTQKANGFLATYHQPTRSLISYTETRETTQHLTIRPAADESSVQHNLIAVANQGIVSHYNALSLELSRRQWLSPPSAYAAAVSNDKQYTAIAGVGSYIDIFDSAGDKSLRLSIC